MLLVFALGWVSSMHAAAATFSKPKGGCKAHDKHALRFTKLLRHDAKYLLVDRCGFWVWPAFVVCSGNAHGISTG